MNLLVKGLGLRKITSKMSRKPLVFSNPNLKYAVEHRIFKDFFGNYSIRFLQKPNS